eukprot:CAMPEP_0113279802 /NCGR_PEP_ID=MMETSP0008_2-20120614/27385_1 /TAXON_ID=97485 /ORGANISM="Prymnesium parvum" /LENGTH=92 /DNA_ID=CAMNT_0000130023 /DNA_START=152 /DNA_END=430 /DNA_ORIENTATION=+ /assembly_acc=CAM_ASM_000153
MTSLEPVPDNVEDPTQLQPFRIVQANRRLRAFLNLILFSTVGRCVNKDFFLLPSHWLRFFALALLLPIAGAEERARFGWTRVLSVDSRRRGA